MERVSLHCLSCLNITLRFPPAVVSLSGPGGATLRTFDYSTGQMILENPLHRPLEGYRLHIVNFEDSTAVAFMEQSRDIVVLTNGHNVQRVGETGKVHWVWESPNKR
jgi:hypothetical protein